jgi:hypothetical protein
MTLPTDVGPVVVPPINFSLVAPGVYRSGHPNKKNFGFLRRLKLKGIMWVYTPSCWPQGFHAGVVADRGFRYVEGSGEYRKDSMNFVRDEGLVLHRFDLSKEAVRIKRLSLQPHPDQF